MRPLVLALLASLTLVEIASSAAPPASDFVYLHDRRTGGRIFGFGVGDEGLEPLSGSPWALVDDSDNCGGQCTSLAWSGSRDLLFSVGFTGVSVWRIAEDGTLSLVEGSPFSPLNAADSETNFAGVVALDRGKRSFVYAADERGSLLAGFEVQDDDTLIDVPDSPLVLVDEPFVLASTRKALLAGTYGKQVLGFRIGKQGQLTPGSADPLDVPANDFVDFTLDPKGRKRLVIAAGDSAAAPLHVFKLAGASTKLTEIAKGPFASGFGDAVTYVPHVVASKGKILFAVSSAFEADDLDLQPLKRKGSALLVAGPGQDSGLTRCVGVALDEKGERLLAASTQQNTLRLFTVDQDTGALALLDEEPLAGDPAGLGTAVFVRR